ncbi:MAG TPA: AraC family transcriptional regulator [Abditibacteriaceae bacterium]|nr:AraC family transcriptional regulator [Abditibacteriaceae bacterium]
MQILFHNNEKTPLGQLMLAGFHQTDQAVATGPLQVVGYYALVYLLEGAGSYRDANHHHQKLQVGDCILIYPGLPVCYGPGPGERWRDFLVIFDGPVFDLWREVGAFHAAHPVCRLEPVEQWLNRFEALFEAPRPLTPSEGTVQICQFLNIVAELVKSAAAQDTAPSESLWLSQARVLLEENLAQPLTLTHVAQQVGMSYDSLRRRFQQQMGMSPARYRAMKRIDAACLMLQRTDMTHHAIAASLGFADEFHFYKRFKHFKGVAPREFRRALRHAPGGSANG